MHSSEAVAGPGLLLQLGRLIMRARSQPPAPSNKHPLTTQQIHVQTQPVAEEDGRLMASLSSHIDALWSEQTPLCVEVLLAPACAECAARSRDARGLLLERWTMRLLLDKSESPSVISSPWLLNAVRSQLHFSQLSAWRARRTPRQHERRRKLSREQCNIKKLEANVDEDEGRLNVVYSIRAPGDSLPFAKPPADHTFPLTDIGNKYLKVVLESLPRLDEVPIVRCACKRRPSVDSIADDLLPRLGDLSIGSRKYEGAINSNIGTPSRRNSIISIPNPTTDYLFKDKVVDDRMHTPCSENGKHKCNCDDESDTNKTQAKKLDERRIKEIAKYKRRIRKEKMRKFCDSTSSEGERKETTSIPILQASRFDRFRAIGCYRNQTYLTLPASRIETKSPFIETDYTPPEYKKTTNTIATQTDFACPCGNLIEISLKCDNCKGMVRSDGTYNLASLGARRKLEDDGDKSLKKQKCDNNISNFNDGIIKRPKLRRLFPIVDRLERIVSDRSRNAEMDMQDLHLMTDDSVFSTPKEANVPPKIDFNVGELKLHNADQTRNLHHRSEESKSVHNGDEINLLANGVKFQPRSESNGTHANGVQFQPKIECNGEYAKGLQCQPISESNGAHANGVQFHPKSECNGDLHPKHESNGCEKDVNGFSTPKVPKRQKTFSINDDDFITYEKCDYGTIDKHDTEIDSPVEELPDFKFSNPEGNELEGQHSDSGSLESLKDEFSFPSPSSRSVISGDSIRGVNGVKSALFQPISPAPARARPRMKTCSGLLGSFEESALQGRLEAVATVQGFTAELGASGAFCPPHRRLPVTVHFYAPGGTAAPYMGHISLGPGGYRVARAGSVQVSLFNPHGTLVKMFCVLYDLTRMPRAATTFLRQRTLHAPHGLPPGGPSRLRYLIHLRFMTSKTGKLYLHTDIRLLVSRKADFDTATALRTPPPPAPDRVRAGAPQHDSQVPEIGCDSASYELRSFTCAPDNPKYSPR